MSDFLSDEEMAKLAASENPGTPDFISDADMAQLADPATPDVAAQLRERTNTFLAPVAAVGQAIDRFTGAPTRAAIGALQDGQNPLAAGWKQFGENPDLAPTGKEISAKAGLSTEEYIPTPFKNLKGETYKVSPAGVAGLGVDLAADPTNALPLIGAAKGSIKLGAETAGIAARSIAPEVSRAAATGGRKAVETTKAILSDFFKPKQAGDWLEYKAIAEKHGIPTEALPEAVEFGPSSKITRVARVQAEGPAGQARLEAFQKSQDSVRDAISEKISEIGDGRVPTRVEAGAAIRDGYNKKLAELLDGSKMTYDRAGQAVKESSGVAALPIPDNAREALLEKIGSVEREASSRMTKGVSASQRSRAAQLKGATDVILQNMGDYDSLTEVLRNLGEVAYGKRQGLELDPPDIRRLRTLYGDVRDTLHATLRDVDPEIAKNLEKTNADLSKFFDERGPLERALGREHMPDETLFKTLVENGDTKKIEALKAMMAPEDLKALKASYLDSLLGRDLEDRFNFAPLRNRIKARHDVIEALFEPEEVKDFTDLIRLGDRFGQPVMSTSGTGASNAFNMSGIIDKAKSAFVDEAWIDTAKAKARAASEEMPTMQGPIKPKDFFGFSGPIPEKLNDVFRQRALDRVLRLDRISATSPLESNDARRELERSNADVQVIRRAPTAGSVAAAEKAGLSSEGQSVIARALANGDNESLMNAAIVLRSDEPEAFARFVKSTDLISKKPVGKQFLTEEEAATPEANRLFDPGALEMERQRIQNDPKINSVEKAKALSQLSERGYIVLPEPAAPETPRPPVAGSVRGLIDALRVPAATEK
jgi:hypothetical protein